MEECSELWKKMDNRDIFSVLKREVWEVIKAKRENIKYKRLYSKYISIL